MDFFMNSPYVAKPKHKGKMHPYASQVFVFQVIRLARVCGPL